MGYGTTATLFSGPILWVQSGSGSISGNASYYASYTAWGSGSDETDAVSGGAEGVIVNITSNASAGDMSESNVASGTSDYSDTMTLAGGVWTDDPSLSASTTSQSGYTSANTSSNSYDEPGSRDNGGYSSGNVTSNAIVTTTSNYNYGSNQWDSTTALSGSGQANWTGGAYYNYVHTPSEDTWSQQETNSSWSPLGSGTAVSETVSSTYAGNPAPDPAYSSSSAQYSLADFSQTGGLWVSGYPFELPTLGTSSGLTTGGTGFPGSGQTLGSIPAVPAIVSNFGTPTLPGGAGVTLLLSATPGSLAGIAPSPVLVGAEWGMAFTPQTAPQTAFAVGNTAGAAAGFTSETMVGAGGVFGGNNVAVVVPVTRAGAVVNYGDYGVSAGNPAEGGGVSGDDDDEGESDDASAGLGGDSADFASLGSQSQGGIAPVTSAIQAHPVSLTDADGGVTNFAYNSSSDLTSLTDPDGTTTTWTLNSQNDVTQETDGQGNSTSFTYNSSNQLTSYTDADGNVRTYQYDSAGQVITETLYATAADAVAGQNAEDTLHYSYDSSGNMTSESDDDSSDTYTYDSQNRLTSVTETSVDAPTVVLTYQYAATGTQPTGVSATIDGVADYQDAYTYNSQGQLTAITRTGQSGGDAVADETIDLTYNAAGQVETIDRYQGGQLAVEADYSYDSAGRLVGLVYEQGTTVLASYSYSYAAAAESGEAAAASTPSPWLPGGAMLPATSVQSIDTAGLDQAISPEQLVAGVTSLDGSVAYSYDAEGQLTAATYSGSSVQPNESYSYDANGDRTSSTSSAAVVIGADNEVLFDGTYTYTYDADGNETAKFIDVNHTGVLQAGDTDVTQYSWNADSRLVQVTTSATYGGPITQTVVYLYDAEGRWVGENIENGSGVVVHQTRYVYDGNQIVLQFDTNGSGTMTVADLSHRYLWGPAVDQLLSDEQVTGVSEPGTVVLPLTDNLGTVRDLAICNLTSGTTAVVNHLDYNSFGQLLSQTNPATGNAAAVDCLFGFTGRPLDTNTGLQNNGRRWYNASLGRWESPDPDGLAAGDTNLYRYVGNSPADETDPKGERETDDRWTILTEGLVDVSDIVNDQINKFLASAWTYVQAAYKNGESIPACARLEVGWVYSELGEDAPGSMVHVSGIGDFAPIAKIGLLLDNNWLTAPNQIVKLKFSESRYHNNSNPMGGLRPKNYWLWNDATKNHGLAPVVRVGEILVGTDKFEHMFQQGYWLWDLAYGGATQTLQAQHPGVAFPDFTQLAVRTAFSEWLEGTDKNRAGNVDPLVKQYDAAFHLIVSFFGVKSEKGVFGSYSTGVISYADMAANEQGYQFYTALYNACYKALLSGQTATVPYHFDVFNFDFPSMNEQRNPNTFVNGVTPDDRTWTRSSGRYRILGSERHFLSDSGTWMGPWDKSPLNPRHRQR